MTSANYRLVLPGILVLGGCDVVASLVAPPSGNAQQCRDYVQHVNGLESCLGLSYDADNFCQGVEGQTADFGPFYQCLVANTSCDGDQPALTVDACSAPLAVSRPATP